ncbi:c-type cytochrome [Methylovulum miyakonense]|uniref:c-type cytochrome n=1 Tax=Methylovulum miyakonense TaxID=645578 RepID=UPI00037BDF22|nr:hypothetical protein [Methylovulum miyakonense]
MNSCLTWFSRVLWLSILAHLGYAGLLMFAPDGFGGVIGAEYVEFAYAYVANVGMLLAQICLFAIWTANDPQRYRIYAWLLVLIHVGMAVFLAIGMGFSSAFGLFAALDVVLALVLGGLLYAGLPEADDGFAQALGTSGPTPENSYLLWFSRMTWLGMLANMVFVIPALAVPEWYGGYLNTPDVAATYSWLRYAGVALLLATVLYAPAALDPRRYHVFAWLSVAARLFAAAFWIWQNAFWSFVGPMATFFVADGTFGLIFAYLLQTGMPEEYRISCANLANLLAQWLDLLASKFDTLLKKVAVTACLLVLGVVGYAFWANMLRTEPETVFSSAEEQFKYGAIGLGMQARVPYYIWQVMPELCANLLPEPRNGWASLGLLYEDGKDLPVGFAKRTIGYPSVEPTCSACHTGSYRATAGGKREITLGSPSQQLDLQSFQWFLYGCVAQPDFTPDNVLAKIREKNQLSATEALFYQYLIIPFTKQALLTQQKAYEWQKSRPTQGRGRTDTFNPTKFNVFHQADDHTIGTVDLPAIWNQRAREGLSLHWDGNNNSIYERNYAAAMAVGATPYSVLPDQFKLITDFVLQLAPPSYPFSIDQTKLEHGWRLYQDNCGGCHDLGTQKVGTVTPVNAIGTDRHRLDSFTANLVKTFHSIQERQFKFDAYSKTDGYSNLPIDGIWIRAPYLHNGSVPDLHALLQAPGQRPKQFYTGYDVYDPAKVGFITDGPEAKQYGFLFDTTQPGNDNSGHAYGTDLNEGEKQDLLEYLKTL